MILLAAVVLVALLSILGYYVWRAESEEVTR